MSVCFPSRFALTSLRSNLYGSFALVLLSFVSFATYASGQQSEWPKEGSSDLIALRSSTSPAERKLSFNLLLVSRTARNASIGSFASKLDSSSVNPDGTVNVEVFAYLSPSLVASRVMAEVLRVNGVISLSAYISDRLQVHLYKWQLLELAANPNVLAIREVSHSTPSVTLAAKNRPVESAPSR